MQALRCLTSVLFTNIRMYIYYLCDLHILAIVNKKDAQDNLHLL